MPPPNAETLLNRFVVKAKFRHMQVLVKLTELGSMRRTAQAVNMTQPAVSQLVAEMERLLETQLFFRHARGVAPTDATRDLLPVAQRILGALEDGSEAVANRLMETGGVVRIAASPAAIGGLIHGALGDFAERHGEIQVHVSESAGSDPLSAIADGSADIVGTREPAAIPEGWVFEHCLDDKLIAVCGEAHLLANSADISPEALGQSRWLLNRVGSVARNRFEELANRHDWPASARCQLVMHIPALTRELLLTGRYLAILPRSVALPWLGTGAIRELDTDVTADLRPLGLLWREKRAGDATTRLVRHLLAHAGIRTAR